MRLGWSVGLPGPFYLAGTIWRSARRRARRAPVWHGTLDGGQCPHGHRREDTARACAAAEGRRRAAGQAPTW